MEEVKTNVELHKEEYTIFQVAINLAIVCIVSGVIIATTYFITNPIAEQKNKMLEQQAMQELVVDANSFESVEEKAGWFAAKQGEETIAYVVPVSTKGYGGEIKMLVAVATDGTVIDFNILSANETPGLGSNASKDSFRNQFVGKGSEAMVVTKDSSNTENIQAMTGATISTTAVTNGVKDALDQVNAFVGGK
jgi:electron transport complex protein RnfG